MQHLTKWPSGKSNVIFHPFSLMCSVYISSKQPYFVYNAPCNNYRRLFAFLIMWLPLADNVLEHSGTFASQRFAVFLRLWDNMLHFIFAARKASMQLSMHLTDWALLLQETLKWERNGGTMDNEVQPVLCPLTMLFYLSYPSYIHPIWIARLDFVFCQGEVFKSLKKIMKVK